MDLSWGILGHLQWKITSFLFLLLIEANHLKLTSEERLIYLGVKVLSKSKTTYSAVNIVYCFIAVKRLT